ncbi:MAG TPA: hypothetical protein VGM77_10585 [Gemmatimonadales bacterium]|jgi:hypothetical protein
MSVLTLAAWLLASSLPVHSSSYFQQHTADRIFADSLVTVLHAASTVQALPTAACTNRHDKFGRLCLGLVALRRAELTTDADDVRAADRAAQRMVAEYPKSAVAWYGLGIARLQLVQIHALAKDGPLQPIGVSNEAAAGYALIHALELDATLQVAGEALALGALPPAREGASRLHERVAMLRRVRDILSPAALEGAGRIGTIAGDPDSAVVDFRLALAHGIADSGLTELRLARAEYKGGHPALGRMAFLAGASDTSSAARTAYREQVSWVASPDELTAWDTVPAPRRSEWLADFWAKRDVASGLPDGARLTAHFARYETALKLYPVIIPFTGVQRNVQNEDNFSGEMADAIRNAMHNGSGAELIRFDGDSRRWGTTAPFRFVRQSQEILDDRGVVYMRHGPADQVATGSLGGTAMEVWKYNLPTGPLVLQFQQKDFSGTVSASVLMPTLVTGNAETRDQVCYLETSLCSRAFNPLTGKGSTVAEVMQGQMTPSRIEAAYLKGSAQIHTAITTDNDVHQFAVAMHPKVQVYGLAHAGSAPRIVLPFALPGDELDADSGSTASRVIYTVRLQAMAEDHATGELLQADTTRRFVASHRLLHGEYLVGTVDVPATAGSYGASVTISQPTGRGAVAHLDDVTVPAGAGQLAISSVVVGRVASDVRWNSGSTDVALNPLNTFPVSGGMTVYFQLSGLHVGSDYVTTYRLSDENARPGTPPRITLASTRTTTVAAAEFTRSIDLQNVGPGRYRLEVTVAGAGATTAGTAVLTIVK